MAEKVKCVKYLGVATTCRITEADWKVAKVFGQATVQWDALNGMTVLGDKFTDDAIRYFRAEDDRFAVLMEDDDPKPSPKPRDEIVSTA